MKYEIPRVPVLVAVLLIMWLASAQAATTFTAVIDGKQNVPPLDVPGTGTAVMILNDAQTELSYDIHVADLLGPELAAHFHNGTPRENGPAVFALPLGAHKTGTWAIPPEYVIELFAGRIYINIHTEVYVLGEIRGNVHMAVPVQDSTWGRVKSLFTNDFR
jgi:hypothetical protein